MTLALVGCRQDAAGDPMSSDAAEAADVATASAASTEDGVSSSGTHSTSTETDSGTTTDADPRWEHVLDESCGDGVIEPGVVCYMPVALPYHGSLKGVVGVDLDGDGDQELLGHSTAVTGMPGTGGLMQLELDGTQWRELAFGPGLGMSVATELDFDIDGDGRNDVMTTSQQSSTGRYSWQLVRDGALGESESDEVFADDGKVITSSGFRSIDFDGDGFPEFLALLFVPKQGALYQAQMFRRTLGQWLPHGPRQMPHIPCGDLGQSVRADFDNDGDEDMFTFDAASSCDPHPAEYDPSWYRYNVFINDQETDTLLLAGDAPMGAKPDGGVLSRDFDQDGNLDVYVGIGAHEDGSAVIHYGRGDGTFADPERVAVDALPEGWRMQSPRSIGNLFGSHDGSMIVYSDHDGVYAIYALEAPVPDAITIPIMPAATPHGTGDFNGDGLLDFVVEDPNDPWSYIAMISWP